MRYVDAGGCIKSLKIVPKQRRRHRKKNNEFLFSFYIGKHWFFQDYLHIKCDLVL